MRKISRVMLAGIILFSFSGCGGSGSDGPSAKWHSVEEGLSLAEKKDKTVVIDFYTSWCKWCEVMEERTFSKQEVVKYLEENFICVRVNAEDKENRFIYMGDEYSPRSLARKFGVKGYPSLAYLESDGELIQVVPGFIPPETYIKVLKYFREEHYKKDVSLRDFLEA
ncbi:MAG TPA: thioredoxin fold domain-containing protein [Candidatus Krumholzibacteriaceae bacterium]|nr:thioredoxin fold domain-containing protein [Candidatus Krumholzibacteriaceae bacterium]